MMVIKCEDPKIQSLVLCMYGCLEREEKSIREGNSKGAKAWNNEFKKVATQIFEMMEAKGSLLDE